MNDTSSKIINKKILSNKKLEVASFHPKSDIILKKGEKTYIVDVKSQTTYSEQQIGRLSSSITEPISKELKRERKPLVKLRFRAEDFEDVE